MSYNADKLIALAANLDKLANELLEKTSEKQEYKDSTSFSELAKEHEEWAKTHPKMSDWSQKDWKEYLKRTKDKGKAEDKEDKEDKKDKPKGKFPFWLKFKKKTKKSSTDYLMNKYASVKEIASLLARYDSTASFLHDVAKAQYELVGVGEGDTENEFHEGAETIARAISSFADKLSYIEQKFASNKPSNYLLNKYADVNSFHKIVQQYDANGPCVHDFAQAIRMSAEQFSKESDLDDPNMGHAFKLMLSQAQIVEDTVPELDSLDQQIDQLTGGESLPEKDFGEEA
jgi:hypothetical protein